MLGFVLLSNLSLETRLFKTVQSLYSSQSLLSFLPVYDTIYRVHRVVLLTFACVHLKTTELVTFIGLGAVGRSVSGDNFYRGHNIKSKIYVQSNEIALTYQN